MKNTLIKVLSFVMALTMIVGMFTVVSTAEEHVHTKGDVVYTKAATCVAIGYTVYKCTGCGEDFTDDVKPATGVHTPVEVAAAAATCDTPALAAGTKCSVCNVVLSGCTAVAGSKPLGHDWISKKVPATCSANEFVQHTCTRCNKTADELLATDPYKKGTVDAAVLADTRAHAKVETAGTKLNHKLDSFSVVTAPTTCVDGKAAASCEICGAKQEIVIKAKHSFIAAANTEWPCVNITVAENAPAGTTATICSLCGAYGPYTTTKSEVKHTFTQIAFAGHVVVAAGTNADFVMGSKLEALGLKVGDALYKAPTCIAKGYFLGKCACGALNLVDIDTVDHTLSAWTWKVGNTTVADPTTAPRLCTEAISRTRKCTVSGCTASETVVVMPAMDHVIEEKTVASTCTTEGYLLTSCKVCAYSAKSNYTAALGHTYGDWTVTGDCTTGITRTKNCTVCKAAPVTETVKAAGSHAFNEGSNYVLIPATCVAKAYYAYECKDCSATTHVAGLDPVGEVNPSNHAELVFVDPANPYKPGAVPTCTKTGTYLKKCAACSTATDVTIIEQTAPMAEHVYGTVCASKKIDLSAVAATCQKEGKKAGEVCVNCGLIKTAQETIAKNPHNHTGAKTPIKTVAANCIAGGYAQYATACCGYVNVPDGTTATGVHVYKANVFKAPTCDAAGNHYYESCTVCEYVNLASVAATGCTLGCGADAHSELLITKDYVIPSLGGHKFDTKIPAVAETCTTEGNIEYYQCSRGCTVYKVNGNVVVDDGKAENGSEIKAATMIRAHGDKYKVTPANKAATCTAKGADITKIPAGLLDANGKICSKCYGSVYETPALGHTYATYTVNAKGVAGYDCTKATYDIVYCSVCKADFYATNFTVGNTAHNWSATPDRAYTANDRVCINGVREGYKCVYCTEVDYRDVKAPVAHSVNVNGAFFDIELTCDKIANWDGEVCRHCGKTVVADASKATADDLTVVHNPAIAHQDPTCTEDGWYVEYCVTCKKELSTPVYEKAFGHKVYASAAEAKADTAAVYNLVKFVDATETEDGYITYVCKRCMEEITLTIPAKKGMILNIAADGVAVSNNQVTVTVKASATNYVFNTIHFGIEINPAQIALNNAKIAYNFAAIDAVTVVASDNGEYVDVLVYVPNGADGKAKNATITGDGVAFVTLTFDVLPTANGDVAIAANSTYNSAALLEDVAFVDEDGAIAKKDNVVFEVVELKTTMLGNVNGDNRLDAGDSIAIQTAIYDKNYNVAADFNKDGKVDLADHVAFVKFVTSRQSVVDYLAAMGIEVEAVVMNYDLKYDLDYDRAVGTDNDKALLAKAVVNYLSNVYYDEFYYETPADTLDEFIEYVALTIAYPNVRP